MVPSPYFHYLHSLKMTILNLIQIIQDDCHHRFQWRIAWAWLPHRNRFRRYPLNVLALACQLHPAYIQGSGTYTYIAFDQSAIGRCRCNASIGCTNGYASVYIQFTGRCLSTNAYFSIPWILMVSVRLDELPYPKTTLSSAVDPWICNLKSCRPMP